MLVPRETAQLILVELLFVLFCRIKCTLKLSCDAHDKRSVGCCGANVTERV